jgi:NTE family protein
MPDLTQLESVTTSMDNSPKKADVVLQGGGVRGIGHVGALLVAEQKGYQWVNIAGTSAGAIVASMLAVGYRATELYDIMKDIEYKRFADSLGFGRYLGRPIFNLIVRGGIHSGKYVEDFVREKLRDKGKQKFGDLIVKGQENDPKYRYRLTVIASDITSGRMLRLPQDAQFYGLNPDDVDIARAVRMSAGFPFFFIPINQRHKSGHICRVVDGGLLSNFPISIFDVEGVEPAYPTFGIRLVNNLHGLKRDDTWPAHPTQNALQIGKAMVSTMMTAHDRLYMDDHTYVRTIAVETDGIHATDFHLTANQADKLYQNGQEAAEKFFETWDFEAYKVAYRSGLSLRGRQDQLHENMKLIQRISQQLSGDLPPQPLPPVQMEQFVTSAN